MRVFLLTTAVSLAVLCRKSEAVSQCPRTRSTNFGQEFNQLIVENDRVDKFVPIEQIPNTKLFTGIYYKLSMERFPSGWVTWAEKKHPTGGWNYVQIDARSDHAPHYRKSEIWYNDIQWFFVPSETNPGWYTLRNRQLPEHLASVSTSEKIGSGHSIVLNINADSGSPTSLWRPVTTKTGQYQLRVKSHPESIITWTEATVYRDTPGSHYIQVDTTTEPPTHRQKYVNGEWFKDTLFRFQDIDRELVGQITQLQLQLYPKLEQLKNLNLTHLDCDNVDRLVFLNRESKPVARQVNQQVVNWGQLKLKMEHLPEMKIIKSVGPISPGWYADYVEFQVENEKAGSSSELQLKTKEIKELDTEVVVPPWSSTEVRICREYFDTEATEVDIDSSVYLDISQLSDSPLNAKGKFISHFGPMPAEQFTYPTVKQLMEQWNTEGETEVVPASAKAKRDMEDTHHNTLWNIQVPDLNLGDVAETFGTTRILGRTINHVIVQAKGLVKGRFGYRAVLASN